MEQINEKTYKYIELEDQKNLKGELEDVESQTFHENKTLIKDQLFVIEEEGDHETKIKGEERKRLILDKSTEEILKGKKTRAKRFFKRGFMAILLLFLLFIILGTLVYFISHNNNHSTH